MRLFQAVPAARIEWRHSAGVFSPGDLARHIAAVERYTFTEGVMGRPTRYMGCGTELAEGKENVIAFMERVHAESVAILKELTPEDLERKGLSPDGSPVTAWKLLRAMVEHEIHHRGEMYVYLALMGIERPPLFGVTEPQLKLFAGGHEAGAR
jgi:uncharacterized damage-inducible protein DinB